jgi:hypothetical protein
MSEVTRLLTILVMGDCGDRSQVLHRSVLLRQADGTVQEGRSHVLSLFEGRGGGSSYRILETASASSIRVALEVADVPGYLAFTLHGEVLEGQLIAVHVEV